MLTEAMYMDDYIRDVELGLKALPIESLWEAARSIVRCARRGGTVYVAGNGGSAANASHFVNGLMKTVRIKAVCLSDNIPTFSAFANDDGYAASFSRQLNVSLNEKDMVILFSCSGESQNIMSAMRVANAMQADCILITMETAPAQELQPIKVIRVKARTFEAAEDLHSVVQHILTITAKAILRNDA